MAEYKKEISFERFTSLDKMNDLDAGLLRKAREASKTAYAPYSQFKVGAALELENGAIVLGSNQENAAFPACICAERVALTSSAVNHPGVKIVTIAVAAYLKNATSVTPASPCGECRQMIAEFQNRQGSPIRIIMQVENELILIGNGIETLLPFHFSGDKLK